MPFNLSSYFSADHGQIHFSASGAYCTVQGNWVYPTQIALDNQFGTCYITASVAESSQYSAATLKETFNTGVLGTRIRDMALSDAAARPPYTCKRPDPNGWDWCGADWCAYYATTVWQRSGVDITDMNANPGSASRFWDVYGKNHGYDVLPAVGDAILFGNSSGIGHVAIVTKVYPDGTVESVGGNEGADKRTSVVFLNPRGSTAGWPAIIGYVRPVLPAGHTTAPTDLTYSMQTGDTVSGSLTVASTVGTVSSLNMLVGPFYSDVDLQLYRPNGSPVSSSDQGLTFTKSANSIQVSITNADQGVWQYQIHANQLDGDGEDIRVWASSAAVPTTIVTQDSETTQY